MMMSSQQGRRRGSFRLGWESRGKKKRERDSQWLNATWGWGCLSVPVIPYGKNRQQHHPMMTRGPSVHHRPSEVNTTPHWPTFCFRQRLLQSHVRKTKEQVFSPTKGKRALSPFPPCNWSPYVSNENENTASSSSWAHSYSITHTPQKNRKKTTKATRQYLKKNTFFLKKIKIFRTISSSFLFFFSYKTPASKKKKKS